ncbi:aldehyde dehydrogenase [Aspergillus uvarum CBS 121591]|uniref:aldehyde dehydrogenase (NAD(+)) n=1 Tax=Aspergillus uvarum CBS 121591 TaxID=1448315 RepID=A0A319BZ98_9EURO|nr:aldehyde dehydrogenase [Aspergillus uvarum CBS 121591]PYH76800.1 aldehyde dehydrogenase [Aspergillus uvarum CBS 121591]
MANPVGIETRLFIGGQFSELVAEAHEAKAADVDRAVESAKAALPAWSELDGSERRRYMLKLADLVEAHGAEFARLEALSMGKPVSTYVEHVVGPATLRYYAGKALDIHGATSLTSKDQLNLTFRQPYGVTGAIIPWNVPLIMICFKVGPSLIAGNTLVLKSSEKAPLTSLLFARLVHEAGFPPGVFNVVSGYGLPCGDAIARHMEIRKIAFTGSTRTGKAIQKAAVESNMKSCTLELGGKSPLIVFDDADLDKAARAAAFSLVSNSGQVCMASTRVYVHTSVAKEFTSLYTRAIQVIRGAVGDPLDPTTRFGPQADAVQYQSVSKYLAMAAQDGLSRLTLDNPIVTGGKNIVAPEVFVEVPEDHTLMQEEIFGAVSCLNTFETEAEVVAKANDSVYGLYASVFTRDLQRAIRLAKQCEAGSVAINTSSPYFCQDLPLGGYKGSGLGRELGQEGLDAWTETKTVYISTA